MKVISENKQENNKYYLIEEDGQEFLAEPIFINKVPRSRVVHDVKKEIEKVLKEDSLTHNNYIKYSGINRIEGDYCLVRRNTEKLIPLVSYLEKENLSLEQSLDWIITLIEVIKEAEANELIWSGLTLNSLWVTDDGHLKIVNPLIVNEIRQYRVQGLRGDEIYKSPEMFSNEEWTEKTRIYSAGIISYYIFTGRFPFQAEEKSDLIDQILYSSPLEPRFLNYNISGELNDFIMKAVKKNHEERFTSLESFLKAARALKNNRNYQADENEKRRNKKKGEKVEKSVRRKNYLGSFWRKRRKAILAVAVVIVLFVGINLLSERDQVITENTTSEEVVYHFYQSIQEKNTILLEETTTVGLKKLKDLVDNVYIFERVRQYYTLELGGMDSQLEQFEEEIGMEREIQEEAEDDIGQIIGIENLSIREDTDGNEPVYQAEYIFFYYNNEETDVEEYESSLARYEFKMEDHLKLKKINGLWQIIEIDGDIKNIIEGGVEELLNEKEK